MKRMKHKKRVWALLITAVLFMAQLPAEAAGNGMAVPPAASNNVTWDGQSGASASSLGAASGDSITVTGSSLTGGAVLTVDVPDITVTSNGSPVSGVSIRVSRQAGSLTVRDLNLTAQDGKSAIFFEADAVLTAEGVCYLTGGEYGSSKAPDAVYSEGCLTLQVGNSDLTAAGGACPANFWGGHGIYSRDNLTVAVGSGGTLKVMGGNSGVRGGGGLRGNTVVIDNNGTVLAESGKSAGVFSRSGIEGRKDITLTGSGSTTFRGISGINLGGVLTVNGSVTAEGYRGGIFFENGSGYKLAGSGKLTARGMGDADWGVGISHASGNLELAFTGSLTVHGSSGSEWGHGMEIGDLTISEAPAFLDIRPGANTVGYAIAVFGSFTNHTALPITVNSALPVLWPAAAPLPEPAPKRTSRYTAAGEEIHQSFPRYELRGLADEGQTLTLSCDSAAMSLKPAALKAVLTAVPGENGSFTFTAVPVDSSRLPQAAGPMGLRPAYAFAVSYTDGGGSTMAVPVAFPAGSAAFSLQYAPASGEAFGNLFMVHIDGSGAVTWLDKSGYHTGRVLADAPDFAVFGVAYQAPDTVFEDIEAHWAKEDIEFAAARGLLAGTGKKQFSPDGAITRGEFAAALGRLAGIEPAGYPSRSFADIKADASYGAYAEWAAEKGIMEASQGGYFCPDDPVTREQMAVMMVKFAEQTGYSLLYALSPVAFTDSGSIREEAAEAVALLQRAGILQGKDGGCFEPQAYATRAEISALLRRFIETSMDPYAAAGWTRNDSGHWLCYKDGKALTGWQTVDNLRYHFNRDGVMHEGWKQEPGTGAWHYWTNAGAAVGRMEIGGRWYNFNADGSLAAEAETPDIQ